MAGKRICCLFIPDFPLRVCMLDEGLDDTVAAVAVAPRRGQGPPGRVKVAYATAAAARLGVKLGMGLVDAELCARGLKIFDVDDARVERAEQTALAGLCARFPTVEPVPVGFWLVSSRGMNLLYRDERGLLDRLQEVHSTLGLPGCVAAARDRFTAMAAAQVAARGLVPPGALQVPSGDEAAFLAPLPLWLLPGSSALSAKLAPLGVTTLGGLAALDPPSVERRYGRLGVSCHRLARGEGDCHLQPVRAPQLWSDRLILDSPVRSAEGLIFLVVPLVEHLLKALGSEGRACAALNLTLAQEDRNTLTLPLELASPTERPRVVIDLLRLKLSKTRLSAGVVELEVEISRATAPARQQQHLFERTSSGTGLAVTLARLSAALSDDAISIASTRDAYEPEARAQLQPARTLDLKQASVSPINTVSTPGHAFRRFPRAETIQVRCDETQRPTSVRWRNTERSVEQCYGPLQYDGTWWRSGGYERLYFRLLLKSGAEVLVFQNRRDSCWHLEGVYD